jgi:hypothetical protein
MADNPDERPPHIDPDQWAAACAVSNVLIPTAHRVADEHGGTMAVAGCLMAAANVAAQHGIPADTFRDTVLRTLGRMLQPIPANQGKPN